MTAIRDAEALLLELLRDSPRPAAEVLEVARQRGLSKKALEKARYRLGITSTKAGMRGGWTWSLPASPKSPGPGDELPQASPAPTPAAMVGRRCCDCGIELPAEWIVQRCGRCNYLRWQYWQ